MGHTGFTYRRPDRVFTYIKGFRVTLNMFMTERCRAFVRAGPIVDMN